MLQIFGYAIAAVSSKRQRSNALSILAAHDVDGDSLLSTLEFAHAAEALRISATAAELQKVFEVFEDTHEPLLKYSDLHDYCSVVDLAPFPFAKPPATRPEPTRDLSFEERCEIDARVGRQAVADSLEALVLMQDVKGSIAPVRTLFDRIDVGRSGVVTREAVTKVLRHCTVGAALPCEQDEDALFRRLSPSGRPCDYIMFYNSLREHERSMREHKGVVTRHDANAIPARYRSQHGTLVRTLEGLARATERIGAMVPVFAHEADLREYANWQRSQARSDLEWQQLSALVRTHSTALWLRASELQADLDQVRGSVADANSKGVLVQLSAQKSMVQQMHTSQCARLERIDDDIRKLQHDSLRAHSAATRQVLKAAVRSTPTDVGDEVVVPSASEIKAQKVRQRLRAAAYTMGGADIRGLFRKIDLDRSGTISEAELLDAIRKRLHIPASELSTAEVAILFEKFDGNGDGTVDIAELYRFIDAHDAHDDVADGRVGGGGSGVTDGSHGSVTPTQLKTDGLTESVTPKQRSTRPHTATPSTARQRDDLGSQAQRDGLLSLHRCLNEAATLLAYRGADWERLFRKFDRNHDGKLSWEELLGGIRQLLKVGPLDLPDAVIALFFEMYDLNRSGTIEIDELVEFARRPWHELDLRSSKQLPSRSKPDHPTPYAPSPQRNTWGGERALPGETARTPTAGTPRTRFGSGLPGARPVRAWDPAEPGDADELAGDSADSDGGDDPVATGYAEGYAAATALPPDWRDRLPVNGPRPSPSPARSRRGHADAQAVVAGERGLSAAKRGSGAGSDRERAADDGKDEGADELWRMQGGRFKFDGEWMQSKDAAGAALPRRNWNSMHARTKPVRSIDTI
jgi:Ca2+-binding EF-hand superfamily protein